MTDFLIFFHFMRPWWLLAILPVILITVLLWLNQKNSQQWQRFISPHLLPHLLDATQIKQKRWPLLGLTALWLISIFALAGPVWEKIPQPIEQDASALVICWDLSPSMLAEDIKPSRLIRSRLKIIDLLQSRKEGQVALIAYSGEAYTVTPLTDDVKTIVNLLPALTPTTLPSVGSNPEMALEQAQQLLKDGGIAKGDILFITDEIDQNAFDFFESELSASPHQLSIWGVGTKEGAPIPLPEGGFAKSRGEMIIAKLNENALLQLSSQINAYYIPMQTTDRDIKSINQLLSSLEKQTQKTDRVFDQWFEHGQYLVFLLLPFFAYFFRRGLIFSLLFIACLPMVPTRPVYAMNWQDLWQTQDQQVQKQLDQGDEDAALHFKGHDRRGSELFKQQKYEEAAKQFTQGNGTTDAYNQGNALTFSGKYEEAIEAYNHALKQDPNHFRAQSNRNIAQQLADAQKKQEQQQEGKDGDQQDENKDNEKKSEDEQKKDGDQKSDSDQQEGENGDQQKSDEPKDSDQQSDQQQSDPNQEESGQKPEDNPYSEENTQQQAEQKQNPEDKDEAKEQQLTKEEAEKEQQEAEQQAQAMTQAQEMSAEEAEEKQMLEQWLRKVPDDPSGLLRNKFQYEYMKRRQSVQTTSPYSNNDPEDRW